MSQGVEQVLALKFFGNHALNVRQPHGHVTRLGRGAGVAPAVAVDHALTGD